MSRQMALALCLLFTVIGLAGCGRAIRQLDNLPPIRPPDEGIGGNSRPPDVNLPPISAVNPPLNTNDVLSGDERQALNDLKTSFEQVENVLNGGNIIVETHCYGLQRMQWGLETTPDQYAVFLGARVIESQGYSLPSQRIKSAAENLVRIERAIFHLSTDDQNTYISEVCGG